MKSHRNARSSHDVPNEFLLPCLVIESSFDSLVFVLPFEDLSGETRFVKFALVSHFRVLFISERLHLPSI